MGSVFFVETVESVEFCIVFFIETANGLRSDWFSEIIQSMRDEHIFIIGFIYSYFSCSWDRLLSLLKIKFKEVLDIRLKTDISLFVSLPKDTYFSIEHLPYFES